MSLSEQPDALIDLPPSAKLVYIVLIKKGPLTQQGIAEESYLPTRTVRYAVKRLEEIDVINEKSSLWDAREHVYYITTDGQEES